MSRSGLRVPKTALKILLFLKQYEELYSLSTELEDEFRSLSEKKGVLRASLWYWVQVIHAVPVYLRLCLQTGAAMFLNNLKITFRHMRKHKSFSSINITGLAVGMACCFMVMLFVQDELSFDKFHKNADNIVRITQNIHRSAEDYHTIRIPSWVGPGLVENFPEVEDAARIVRWAGTVSSGEKRFDERLFFADPSFFKIFTFPLLRGDLESALLSPDNVIISRKMAEKYFGNENVLGRTLTVDGQKNFTVSGLLADIPKNSHIKLDFIAPFDHVRNIFGEERYNGQRVMAYTYLMLNKRESSLFVQEKLPGFVTSQKGEKYASIRTFSLQSLTSIHLNSHTSIEFEKNSRIKHTYILSTVAILILLIACVNYINLSTARASRRSLEVGVRKVVGADRHILFRQFMGESMMYSFLALFLALGLARLLLPLFNTIMDKELTMNVTAFPLLYLGFLGIALIVGSVSGSYPALLLASFRPVEILKGKMGKARIAGLLMRKGLVVFQFSLAVVFITGMLVINRQYSKLIHRCWVRLQSASLHKKPGRL